MVQPKEDRRIQRTRQLLSTALLKLIEERGYDSLTVNDITEQANVGRATFYLHYQDKEQLLVESLEEMFSQLEDLIAPLSETLGEEHYSTATRLLFQHFGDHHRLYRVLLTEKGAAMVFPRLLEIVSEIAEQIAGQDVISKSVEQPQTLISTNLVGHYVAGAFLGSVVWWLNNNKPYSAEQMAAVYVHLMDPGVTKVLGIASAELPELSDVFTGIVKLARSDKDDSW
ncbi:Biofilm operon icaADBC HTH-type negative transcriptional regulator IcaR [Stanieria sp. NIES-3757]|nr:Biofilm operon icaADBC HTH-type negative transcriptional regulator IcaR [Stanieria sp. NIES-3757]